MQEGSIVDTVNLNDYVHKCVDNLSEELQKLLMQLWILDVEYQYLLDEVSKKEEVVSKLDDESSRMKSLLNMQQSLIQTHEVGDEKLDVLEKIRDLLESSADEFQENGENLAFRLGQFSINNSLRDKRKIIKNNSENKNKRRKITFSTARKYTKKISNGKQIGKISNGKQIGKISNGKQIGKRQKVSEQERLLANIKIKPGEPIYCFCEKPSLGDMVACENDLCPIEWFHFSCVNVKVTPKGDWFCPNCRGDDSTVLKPRHILKKQLEDYNLEKERKVEQKSKKKHRENVLKLLQSMNLVPVKVKNES